MSKKIIALILISTYLFSGCATIVRGSKQDVNINAYDAKSNDLVSANCTVSNDEGTFRTSSNRSVIVERDKDFLTIDCRTDDLVGRTVIDGEVNIGFWAIDFFFIDLCIISCFVDGLSGSWAEYPSMIDVPMDPKQSQDVSSHDKQKTPVT